MSTKYKIGLPVALMALAVSNYGFAVNSYTNAGDCCPQPVCDMVANVEAIPTIKPNCCEGPTLCTEYPTCMDCYNTHMDIGFLFEQFRITQTDFGYTTCSRPDTLFKSAQILQPRFDLEWGVTASLGYYFDHDNWFFDMTFDWIRAKGFRHVGHDWNESIEPTNIWKSRLLSDGDCFTFAHNVKDIFKVSYYMLQFDLARGSYISTLVALEPHIGLRTAWFFFDNRVEFTGGEELGNDTVQHIQKTHFWGIGPEWGLNSKWYLCQGFSFYLDNTFALLFGEVRERDNVRFGPGCGEEGDRTIAHKKHQVMSPAAQIVLGIMYDKCVCDNTQHISIKAGLDTTHYWNNWNHINTINEAETCFDVVRTTPTFHQMDDAEVSLIGLRVELGWDF